MTAGGKNVAPAVLEDRLRGHPLVSQCVVVGDERPFIAALVTLDADDAARLARLARPARDGRRRRPPRIPRSSGRARPGASARANEAVSRAESIRQVAVLDIDFTEANGYLTPSLKVKRARVLADFAQQIDAIYAARTEVA